MYALYVAMCPLRPSGAGSMKPKDHYEARNRTAAGVILVDVDRYGGPEAALVRWARAWMERNGGREQEGAQMRLFEKSEAA